jgi:DNA-directed RNA polymerase subunit RPC12/RpoP
MTIFLVEHPNKITSQYRCGACWDTLVATLAEDGKYKITCVNCGDHVPGFVHMRYVERQQSDSFARYLEARRALHIAWPWLFPGSNQPVEKVLSDLGF